MRKGVAVSPGVAVGRAYCVDQVLAPREAFHLSESTLPDEVNRFQNACSAAAAELDGIITQVSRQVGEDEAAIFRGHQLLIRDASLINKVKTIILETQVDAPTALHGVLDEYSKLFAQIEDEYIRDRMADIRDVIGRIMAQLSMHDCNQRVSSDDPVILVAPEILPSQALSFQRLKVSGIVTEVGGATGHAAILARSMGIPSVSGLRGILREVKTGDLLAIDGREGHVYVNPGAEVESAYRKIQREYVDIRDRLVENRDQEAVSIDGAKVALLANVNGPADAVLAVRAGASGVGLYRTEYLFLTHPTIPNEDEQLNAYRQVIEAAPNRNVTIRTLDLGGDKHVPYLGQQREANPFMGWRSVRLSVAYPEFFKVQLRAIMRAGLYGDVRLLIPMISTIEEIRNVKRVIGKTQDDLRREGIAFQEHIPFGVMVEVPAAALCVNDLLDEVDFISIGSNDLIQYVMAADRDNPKVAHLCEPFNPPIMRLLNQVITACDAVGKPVTLCGEMAGRPRCFLPLFGMGLRGFSMSPSLVPPIKELVRSTRLAAARKIARSVIQMRTIQEIRTFLTEQTRAICPSAAILDLQE